MKKLIILIRLVLRFQFIKVQVQPFQLMILIKKHITIKLLKTMLIQMSRYHNRADIRLAYRHLMFFNEKNPEVGMVV